MQSNRESSKKKQQEGKAFDPEDMSHELGLE